MNVLRSEKEDISFELVLVGSIYYAVFVTGFLVWF